MTPQRARQIAKQAQSGDFSGLLPVFLLAGEEHYLRDGVVRALRDAALGRGPAAFNEDRFVAGECDVGKVLAAASTVPMMSERRFVLVRNVERWEGRGEDSQSAALDELARYAEKPVPSTCLVLTAEKLDGRRKLATMAKKNGFLVECAPLSDDGLIAFAADMMAERGHRAGHEVAEKIAQLVGAELASIADACERLSLFVGPGAPITEDAVAECVARVRTEDTWALVDAVGARDGGRALALMHEVFDPRDRGLPLVGALAWSFRQLLRLKLALAEGARVDEAGRRAGIFQPGRAELLGKRAARLPDGELERWLGVLARADMDLKGSRRPPRATLESALLEISMPPGARPQRPART
jgi:DNA polymerase-3 subunit delta